jgi:hypothetical protein
LKKRPLARARITAEATGPTDVRISFGMSQQPLPHHGRGRRMTRLAGRDHVGVEGAAHDCVKGLEKPTQSKILFDQEAARHRKPLASDRGIYRERRLAEADPLEDGWDRALQSAFDEFGP